MAGRIPQQFIDDLVARIDIVEVIDERVPLKKAGKEHVACCPFHAEKTPSFKVNRDKQLYKCFGCGAHGTALGFLMDYAHMEFVEAIEELAERAGMEVPREVDGTGTRPSVLPLYDVLKEANAFYRKQLREHPRAADAIDYLKRRGLSGKVAAEFEIGYAPPGWDNLMRALGGSDEAKRTLALAGLSLEKEGGSSYDRFRDRIMFPIHDRRGRVVGFGGRVLDQGEPKYLNSPETPAFHKGSELYGLYQARQANRRLDRIVVVEGYMDVVALAQFDIRYAVATLGTSATADHLERLFRTAPEIIFCFDGDRAGRDAAWRALQTALPLLHDTRQAAFMFPPEGEDPDSIVRAAGREGFENLMSDATSLTSFLFDRLTKGNRTDIDDRAGLVERAKPLISKMPRGPLRELAMKRIGELSGLDRRDVGTLVGERHADAGRTAIRTATQIRSEAPSLLRKIITLLLHYPQLVSLVPDTTDLRDLDRPGMPVLIELLELLRAQPNLTTAGIVEHTRESEAGRHLAKLAAGDPPVLENGLEQEFIDSMDRILHALKEQRFDYLSHRDRQGLLNGAEQQEYITLIASQGSR